MLVSRSARRRRSRGAASTLLSTLHLQSAVDFLHIVTFETARTIEERPPCTGGKTRSWPLERSEIVILVKKNLGSYSRFYFAALIGCSYPAHPTIIMEHALWTMSAWVISEVTGKVQIQLVVAPYRSAYAGEEVPFS
ncbi:hypothetical protein EVAR_97749_1 [Eumeta japonica]|uniref:Uncharacterized protein n=1 Tax=Eumeta variegata TaxID=151549 RepID=A0A4C1XAF6_EUMVA|nr:hypothetical protein EVAR_97749_1 [Eumeta japonica]